MIYDLYAEFWNEDKKCANFNKVDRIEDTYYRIKLCSLNLTTDKNKKWARENKYKHYIEEYSNLIKQKLQLLKKLDLNEFKALPSLPYLILIKIKFKLRKPYISRDDEDFYIIDNPICKDKVFKVPIARSTSWKGILRHIAVNIFLNKLPTDKYMAFEERAKIVRLFGNEKDHVEILLDYMFNKRYQPDNPEKTVSKEFFEYLLSKKYVNKNGYGKGRLIFYSTFFNGIDLDVIAPHKRTTKTVKVPILFETVPENSKGTFTLIYVPFDIIHDKERLKKEVPEDLELLKKVIPKMMLEYGFSAKKTSGYGVVDESINGFIRVGSTEVRFNSWNDFIKSIDKAYKVIIHEQGS